MAKTKPKAAAGARRPKKDEAPPALASLADAGRKILEDARREIGGALVQIDRALDRGGRLYDLDGKDDPAALLALVERVGSAADSLADVGRSLERRLVKRQMKLPFGKTPRPQGPAKAGANGKVGAGTKGKAGAKDKAGAAAS